MLQVFELSWSKRKTHKTSELNVICNEYTLPTTPHKHTHTWCVRNVRNNKFLYCVLRNWRYAMVYYLACLKWSLYFAFLKSTHFSFSFPIISLFHSPLLFSFRLFFVFFCLYSLKIRSRPFVIRFRREHQIRSMALYTIACHFSIIMIEWQLHGAA